MHGRHRGNAAFQSDATHVRAGEAISAGAERGAGRHHVGRQALKLARAFVPYFSMEVSFTDDHARLLTLLAPSLATSISAVPKPESWGQTTNEPRRPAAGELRLLKR